MGARLLVAGIGNVFLGDDGFGVALVGRVEYAGVDLVDFGIRGPRTRTSSPARSTARPRWSMRSSARPTTGCSSR